MSLSPAELLEVQRWRYATKVFDPGRTIPPETWEALEESLVLSASSFGLQPWKFLVIDDPALRAELRVHSWNQGQITDSSHLVVLLAKRRIDAADVDRLITTTAETRGLDPASLDGYRQLLETTVLQGFSPERADQWAVNQVYIALGNLLTSAALLQVDTCPIEGFSPPDYDRILGLEGSPYRTAVVVALGYRSADDKYAGLAKVRYPRQELIERR
ncbi:NAD(P)H-dependent oxidoreductase [Vulcanococcus limneticus]|uniref:NAD(P)H-dependent oxidoreductase n=1 Tax=Vulcanococcus limneticus TaxID=2170428 RepID=UPI00398BD9E1